MGKDFNLITWQGTNQAHDVSPSIPSLIYRFVDPFHSLHWGSDARCGHPTPASFGHPPMSTWTWNQNAKCSLPNVSQCYLPQRRHRHHWRQAANNCRRHWPDTCRTCKQCQNVWIFWISRVQYSQTSTWELAYQAYHLQVSFFSHKHLQPTDLFVSSTRACNWGPSQQVLLCTLMIGCFSASFHKMNKIHGYPSACAVGMLALLWMLCLDSYFRGKGPHVSNPP